MRKSLISESLISEVDCITDYLVMKGPPDILLSTFPRNEKNFFSKFHCTRKLANGEYVGRPWVIYSQPAGRIYCYYCKLFSINTTSALSASGFNNWSNLHTRLSMKILKTICKPHANSGSYTNDFVVERPLTKNVS